MLLVTNVVFSQISIGEFSSGVESGKLNPTPKGILDLQGIHYLNDSVNRNMGMVIPRVDTIKNGDNTGLPDILNPNGKEIPEGTMVFSRTPVKEQGCIKVKNNDAWQDCLVDSAAVSRSLNYEIYGGINFKVKKVSAGNKFSLVVGSTNNSLYSTGANTNGKTGTGTTSGNTGTFTLIMASETIDVSAGYEHALAVSSDGALWAWGAGANYRTGHNNTKNKLYATKVKGWPEHVKAVKVAGGYANSLILGEDGKVYSMGSNTDGVNGNASTSGNVQIPTEIKNLSDLTTGIVDISLSRYTAGAVTDDGQVYVWGNAANGRLANLGTGIVSPAKLEFPEKIKQIALGANHGLAVNEGGNRLYGWGLSPAFGDPAVTIHSSPIDITEYIPDFNPAVDSINFITVSRFDTASTQSSGAGSSIIITNKGIYGAGQPNAARIGLGYIPKENTPGYTPDLTHNYFYFKPLYTNALPDTVKFKMASIGDNHSLLVEDFNQAIGKDTGGYGYGMGNTTNKQMGAYPDFGDISFPILIKI